MQVVLSGRRGVIHPVEHGMNRMHLQVAFMFHPYHPHHLQKLTSSSNLDDCESSQNMMKMEDLENLMKLPTMVLFEEVMSGGTVKLILEDGVGNESKVKKVKTITARSASDGASAVGSSFPKSYCFPDPHQKTIE
ncbi:hypothetical protein OIU85_019808, partial [Salix viminalis]